MRVVFTAFFSIHGNELRRCAAVVCDVNMISVEAAMSFAFPHLNTFLCLLAIVTTTHEVQLRHDCNGESIPEYAAT